MSASSDSPGDGARANLPAIFAENKERVERFDRARRALRRKYVDVNPVGEGLPYAKRMMTRLEERLGDLNGKPSASGTVFTAANTFGTDTVLEFVSRFCGTSLQHLGDYLQDLQHRDADTESLISLSRLLLKWQGTVKGDFMSPIRPGMKLSVARVHQFHDRALQLAKMIELVDEHLIKLYAFVKEHLDLFEEFARGYQNAYQVAHPQSVEDLLAVVQHLSKHPVTKRVEGAVDQICCMCISSDVGADVVEYAEFIVPQVDSDGNVIADSQCVHVIHQSCFLEYYMSGIGDAKASMLCPSCRAPFTIEDVRLFRARGPAADGDSDTKNR